jgi:hypothetical protein
MKRLQVNSEIIRGQKFLQMTWYNSLKTLQSFTREKSFWDSACSNSDQLAAGFKNLIPVIFFN